MYSKTLSQFICYSLENANKIWQELSQSYQISWYFTDWP